MSELNTNVLYYGDKTADTPAWIAPIPKAAPVKKVKGKTARLL